MRKNNYQVFILAVLAAQLFAACPEQRPTATFSVCSVSGQLAGTWCPADSVVTRKYYVDPRPGEPIAPVEMCTAHKKPIETDPDPLVKVDVCSVSSLSPGEWCPERKTIEVKTSTLPLAGCDVHKKPSDPDPIIQIEVCSASSLMPGEWCLDRKTIGVKQSLLPLGNCGIHSPPRVPVYVGALDMLGATGDTFRFLKTVKVNGGDGLRVIICWSWQGPQSGGSPYVQVGNWTHDNGKTFPLYRLGTPEHPSWNPAFWNHLSEVLAEMKRLKLTAWLVAEDFCSLKGDSRDKYNNPFYSSEEALGPSTPGGIWGDAMKPYHAALFQKIIETANASGVYYILEAMNEYDIIDGSDAEFLAWHIWSNDALMALGFPRSRIIASPGRCAGSVAGQVGIYSPHGIGRPDQVVSIAGVATSKTLYSSDGFWGGQGPADARGRRGVGLDVADALALKLISVGAVGYELFDRGIWGQNNDRSNLDLFSPAVLLHMTRNK